MKIKIKNQAYLEDQILSYKFKQSIFSLSHRGSFLNSASFKVQVSEDQGINLKSNYLISQFLPQAQKFILVYNFLT